jgi:hypothetical protein
VGPRAESFRKISEVRTPIFNLLLADTAPCPVQSAVVCSVERKGWWRGSDWDHSFANC